MIKRLKHKHMEEMEQLSTPMKRYHQTRKDRRHEAEGMKKRHEVEKRHRPKKYHQSRMDRMHESEGMKKHNKDHHRTHHR